MKRKIIIKIIIITLALLTLAGAMLNVKALTSSEISELEGIYGPQDEKLYNIGNRIVGVVSYICYGAAVIVLIVKGVQFMAKAPSAKAEAKKELVNYAIGAFILFAVGGIIQIVANIARNRLF